MGGPGGLPRVRPAHPGRMDLVRLPRVAGYFYPGEKAALEEEVGALLAGARTPPLPGVRGVLSPHAGYA